MLNKVLTPSNHIIYNNQTYKIENSNLEMKHLANIQVTELYVIIIVLDGKTILSDMNTSHTENDIDINIPENVAPANSLNVPTYSSANNMGYVKKLKT